MPALEPYPALFFYAESNASDVNEAYRQAYDDGGFLRHDALAEVVTVVACEVERGIERVWFIRQGRLENRESWQIRTHV